MALNLGNVDYKKSERYKGTKKEILESPKVPEMTFDNMHDATNHTYSSRYIDGFNTVVNGVNIRINEWINGLAQNYYTNGNSKYKGSIGFKESWTSLTFEEKNSIVEKKWKSILKDLYLKNNSVKVKFEVVKRANESVDTFSERISIQITQLTEYLDDFSVNKNTSNKKYYIGLVTPSTSSTKTFNVYCSLPMTKDFDGVSTAINIAKKLTVKELTFLAKMDEYKDYVAPPRIAGIIKEFYAE